MLWIAAAAVLLAAAAGQAHAQGLESVSTEDPRLANAFGAAVPGIVNVGQQVQIVADITNRQDADQGFVYLVQIRDGGGFVVSLSWFLGELAAFQKLSPAVSWMPEDGGEYEAEIFVWEDLSGHRALAETVTVQIRVS